MKLSAFVLAMFASIAVAAPVSESTGNEDLMPNAAEIMSELDGAGDPPAVDHVVKTIMSNNKQHVGQLSGDTFYNIIQSAIANACPAGQAGEVCDRNKAWQHHRIQYYDAKNDRMADNAHITIRVLDASFPYGYHGLREIFMSHVARTFVNEVEDQKNCYTIKNVHMCNVGQYVYIQIPGIQARLMVEIKFNGNTNRCVFDCMALIEKGHRTCESFRGQYAQSLRVPDTPQAVQCNVQCLVLEELKVPNLPNPTDITRVYLQVIDGKETFVPYNGPDVFVEASTGNGGNFAEGCTPE